MDPGQKPKLKDIYRHVMPYACSKWDEIGLELEVGDEDGKDLDKISQDCNGDERKCFKEMIKRWLQSDSSKVTWGTLVDCLQELNIKEAVEAVESHVIQCTGATATGQSTSEQSGSENNHESRSAITDSQATESTSEQFEPSLEDQKKPLPHNLEVDTSDNTHLPTAQNLDLVSQASIPTGTKDNLENQDASSQLETDPLVSSTIPEQGTSPMVLDTQSSTSNSQVGYPIVSIPLETSPPTPPNKSTAPMVPVWIDPPTETIVQQPAPNVTSASTVFSPPDSIQPASHVTPAISPPDFLTVGQSESQHSDSLEAASPNPQPTSFELKLPTGMKVRNYQWELAEPGIRGENYIFVAPTGSGKTLICAIVICEQLKKIQSSGRIPKVIFLVNTKPLASQQKQQLDEKIQGARVECITGDSIGSVKDALSEFEIVVCTTGKFLDEVSKGEVKLTDISLLVMDECHHARKSSAQAQLMVQYLQKKEKDSTAQLPQVIGLTASPGAGDNPDLEDKETIDHLVNLCALMNATSGIVTVRKHKEELEEFTTKPTLSREVLQCRNRKEPFVHLIEQEMTQLESSTKMKCSFYKWSQQYETKIQQEKLPLELSANPKFRDAISTYKLLLCYSQALNIYMDLRRGDALKVLEDFTDLPDDPTKCTDHEQALKTRLAMLIEELKSLPIVENPLLQKAEEIIFEKFEEKPESRGVFFVRTKRHASAVCEWIESLAGQHQFLLKPQLITGHTRETGSGMTQADQEVAMESFRSGDSNILVATSVAEEGLDVPACNFVIRFQHVSNEIAKAQTQGRARAEDSEVFTILSSDSKLSMKEIKNAERLELVNKVMTNNWFPRGKILKDKLVERQKLILQNQSLKQLFKRQRGSAKREHIKLMCRKCKIVACFGSDVFTADSTNHVVPVNEIKTKLVKRPHHKPGRICDTISKTHKIYCEKCNADWGIMCVWPFDGFEFPVLKCKSFIFQEGNNQPRTVAQWSKAPFEPLPLNVWIDLNNEKDDEDSDEQD